MRRCIFRVGVLESQSDIPVIGIRIHGLDVLVYDLIIKYFFKCSWKILMIILLKTKNKSGFM